ncbi:MAG: DUF4352 domain-containing protein [Candidatus Moranbacteria bacterium]|nr:DUF4352 domain-containing protein [Candidatus Moranbacteria bacterium]
MENQQSQEQTKKCPKCGEDVLVSAKKCKHCQADLRNWFARHKILSGILAIIVLIIFSSIVSSYNKTQETMGDLKKTAENNTKELDKYQAIVDTGKKDEKVNKIGDSVELGGAIITINKVVFSQGGQFSKPQPDNEWINLNITIENTESSEQYITTLGQMFIRDSEGNSYQVAVTDKSIENVNNNLDGTVIAKSKRTGWVGFEIKKDVKGLQFQYNGSIWGGGNVLFDLGR